MFLPKTSLAEEHGLNQLSGAYHERYRDDIDNSKGIQQRFSLNPWEETQGQNINLSFANLDCSAIDGAGDQANDFVESFIKPRKYSPRPSPSLLQRIVDVQTSGKKYGINQTQEVRASVGRINTIQEPKELPISVLSPAVDARAQHPIYQDPAPWKQISASTTSPTTDILARAQLILRQLEAQTPAHVFPTDQLLLPGPRPLQHSTPQLAAPLQDETFIAQQQEHLRHFGHVLQAVDRDPKLHTILGRTKQEDEQVKPQAIRGQDVELSRRVERAILCDVRPAVGVQATVTATPTALPTAAARSVLSCEQPSGPGFLERSGLLDLTGQLDLLRRQYAVHTRIPEALMTSDKQKEALKSREREALASVPIPDISDILIPVKGYEQPAPKLRAERHSVRIDPIQEWLMKPESQSDVIRTEQLTNEYQQFDKDIERIIQKQEKNAAGAQDLLRKLAVLNKTHEAVLSRELPYPTEHGGTSLEQQHESAESSSRPEQPSGATVRQVSERRLSQHEADNTRVPRQVSPNRIGVVPAVNPKHIGGAATRVDVQPAAAELPSGYVLLQTAGRRLLAPVAIASTRLNHIPKDKFKERKLNEIHSDHFVSSEHMHFITVPQDHEPSGIEQMRHKKIEFPPTPKPVERQPSDYSMPTPTNMVADPELLTRGITPITPPEGMDNPKTDGPTAGETSKPALDQKPLVPDQLELKLASQTPIPEQPAETATTGEQTSSTAAAPQQPHATPTQAGPGPQQPETVSNTAVPPLPLSTLPGPAVRAVRSPNRITLSSSPRLSNDKPASH